MADHTKIGKLILIALIIISLAISGIVFGLFQKERAKNLNLQVQLEDVKTKQRLAEARLDESKKLISDMQLKLQDAQTQIESLNKDVQKERDARQQVLTQIDQLKSDLENQKEMRVTLEKKITQAQDEANKAKSQVKELEARKNELEQKLKSIEDKSQPEQAKSRGVELGKIVVGPETNSQLTDIQTTQISPQENKSVAAELSGKILVINKDYNFAVINLGNKDGVKIGDVFSVYHKDKFIGDVKVEKVHDSMSAAGFTSSDVKNKFSEGDKVVLKNK